MDPAFRYWALQLARSLVTVLDLLFLGPLLGISLVEGCRREKERAGAEGKTAHIVTVLCRAQYMPVMPFHSVHNFLYVHDCYVNPDYVLNHANSCLFFVDKDRAVFCISEPGEDLYDTRKFPFLYMSLYASAKKLLILPLAEFNELADKMGNPLAVEVCVVGMTARCGSTLLSQMMNRVPNTRSMSEPMATVNIYQLLKSQQISQNEAKRLLRSTFRILAKVEPGSKVERIFMKLTQFNNIQMPTIKELFPKFKMLFNTRLPAPSIRSFSRIFSAAEGTLFYKLGLNWKYFRVFPFPDGPKYQRVLSRLSPFRQNIHDEEISLLLYASGLAAFLEYKHLYHHVVLYEKLTESPEWEVGEMFEILGISKEYVPKALEATGSDSQGLIFAGPGNPEDTELGRKMDRLFEDLGIDLSSDTRLEQFQALVEVPRQTQSQ